MFFAKSTSTILFSLQIWRLVQHPKRTTRVGRVLWLLGRDACRFGTEGKSCGWNSVDANIWRARIPRKLEGDQTSSQATYYLKAIGQWKFLPRLCWPETPHHHFADRLQGVHYCKSGKMNNGQYFLILHSTWLCFAGGLELGGGNL